MSPWEQMITLATGIADWAFAFPCDFCALREGDLKLRTLMWLSGVMVGNSVINQAVDPLGGFMRYTGRMKRAGKGGL